MTTLRVAMTVKQTEAEGPGVRYALWVQGCTLRCAACCNPEFLPNEGGTERTVDSLLEEIRSTPGEGISLLGGEPFQQPGALAELALRAQGYGKSVMVYTGYTLEELWARNDRDTNALLFATDLLVDGRFDVTQRTTQRRWVGSENQRMHFLTDRYEPTDPRFHEPNTLEFRIRDGALEMNGFPVKGAATRLIDSRTLNRATRTGE